MKSKVFVLVCALLLIFSITSISAAGQKAADEKPLIGFISNSTADFWNYAAAAVESLEEELGVKVDFLMPPTGTPEEQTRFIESLVARGAAGIAISAADPANMTPYLKQIVQDGIPVVTHDSDAPDSGRLAYVGLSNYASGRMAGGLIRELLPTGGKFVIFVGHLDAQNAVERRQGIIDELNGEPYQDTYPGFMTSDGSNIKLGDRGQWTLIRTMIDHGDASRAKANAEDAILRYPDMDLMFGMWSANGPAILSALGDANMLGKMKVIGWSQEEDLLQGIQDGHAYATMGSDPFNYAVEAISILAKVAKGEDPGIPASKFVEVPAIIIKQSNVDEVWDNYRLQLNEGTKYLKERGLK